MNMRSSAPDGICAYLADTAASVFPHVLEEDVPLSTNRLLFASEEEISGELLLSRCEKLENEKLRDLMVRSAGKLTVYEGGDRILTDDRAPVELLGMKTIDDIIREEVQYYRRILREEGSGALLSAFA